MTSTPPQTAEEPSPIQPFIYLVDYWRVGVGIASVSETIDLEAFQPRSPLTVDQAEELARFLNQRRGLGKFV